MRFPEFSGEWETSILLDVCEINPKTPSLVEEFVYIDLESVEKGTILHENVISRDDAPSRAQRVLKFNDILFQCVRPYQKNNLLFSGDTHTLQYVASTGYAQIRTDKQNPAFLYQLLNTQKFVDQVMLRCTGTSYPAINANDLSKIPICYPLQIEEQNKIAKLLSLLDNRIETQKKVIEDLKKLKDAISKSLLSRSDLLERMIPLSQVGMLKNGYAFQSSSYDSSGEYEIITIANVTGERYISTEGCNRIHTTPSDLQLHQELKDGDILISLTGNVGRVSLCNKEGKYLLNQRVGLLELQVGVNREFVYQAISSPKFERGMSSCGQGAAQMNIGKGDVENFVIPYSNNTQNLQRISLILKGYDELVLIESKRLQLLQSQKRYFISTLFI